MKRQFRDLRAANLARSKAAGAAVGAESEVPSKPLKLSQRQLKGLLKRTTRKNKPAEKKTTTPWHRLSSYVGRSKVNGGLPSLGKRR